VSRPRWPRTAARAALLAAIVAASAALAATAPPLRATRWLAPGTDRVTQLTTAPAECLAGPSTTAIETGRAAFRSPLLLGGQAARAGIACESCHRNGRGNPAFAFPGISGAPGTADVTASLFSKTRGDGLANPKPIPDLARDPRKIAAADLPAFVTGLIVEEFDGAPPPPAVLAGLVAYLGAIQPGACPDAARVPLTATATLTDANRAITAARAALASGDTDTAIAMVQAARAQLFLIDERLPADARKPVAAADAALAGALTAIRTKDPAAGRRLATWQAAIPGLTRKLAAAQSRSLYDPARLSQALSGR
jgi:hypothetical protein